MSADNDIVISVKNVSKCFEMYAKPVHRLYQTLCAGHKKFYKEFWALGLETVCEDRQAGGRADIVVNYRKAIYVFELKRDESAAKALEQIREKGYAKPHLADAAWEEAK